MLFDAHLTGRRVVDVDALELDRPPAVALGKIDVRLAEDREQVAGAGLLEVLAHHEVGVHAYEQNRHPSERPLGRVRRSRRHRRRSRRSCRSRCGSNAKARTQSSSMSFALIASRAASLMNDGPTVPYCGPIAIPTRAGPPSAILADADRLDVRTGVRFDEIELEPLLALAVLDARLPQVLQDRRLERCRARIRLTLLLTRGRLTGERQEIGAATGSRR